MNVVTWESLAAPSVVIFLPQLFLQTVGQLHTVDIQPVVHAIADGSDGEVEQAGLSRWHYHVHTQDGEEFLTRRR